MKTLNKELLIQARQSWLLNACTEISRVFLPELSRGAEQFRATHLDYSDFNIMVVWMNQLFNFIFLLLFFYIEDIQGQVKFLFVSLFSKERKLPSLLKQVNKTKKAPKHYSLSIMAILIAQQSKNVKINWDHLKFQDQNNKWVHIHTCENILHTHT